MALQEIEFASANGRDTIQAWLHTPIAEPKAIVQIVHGLGEQSGDLGARVGAPVELAGVAVRRLDVERDVDVPPGLLTTDAVGLVTRGDIDVVVEVIGGIEPARSLILAALANGAIVWDRQPHLPPPAEAAAKTCRRRPDRRTSRHTTGSVVCFPRGDRRIRSPAHSLPGGPASQRKRR